MTTRFQVLPRERPVRDLRQKHGAEASPFREPAFPNAIANRALWGFWIRRWWSDPQLLSGLPTCRRGSATRHGKRHL